MSFDWWFNKISLSSNSVHTQFTHGSHRIYLEFANYSHLIRTQFTLHSHAVHHVFAQNSHRSHLVHNRFTLDSHSVRTQFALNSHSIRTVRIVHIQYLKCDFTSWRSLVPRHIVELHGWLAVRSSTMPHARHPHLRFLCSYRPKSEEKEMIKKHLK